MTDSPHSPIAKHRFTAEHWEDDEYILCVDGKPTGMTMHKQEVQTVVRWMERAGYSDIEALGRSSSVLEELEALVANWHKQADASGIELGKVKYSSKNEAYIKGLDAACRLHSQELHALIGRYREPK